MTRTALESIDFLAIGKVYPPAEDSFLLAHAVSVKKNSTVLDVGCGSGIQSINAILKGAKKVSAVDKNPDALKCTLENAKKLGLGKKILAKKSDLFEKITEKFDTIIFNPPYVPTGKIELPEVDGGKRGREVLDRFLEKFPKFLKKNGECFFLQSTLNGTKETEKKLKENGMCFEIIARKKLFFEELMVFRAWKKI